MSVCSPALATKKIPTCTQEIIIGTISTTNSPIGVAIKDITTERIEIIQSSSDNAGLVSIDISDHQFAENHSYELSIFLASNDFDDKEDIVIGSSTTKLVQLDFTDVYENADEQFVVPSVTLQEA